MVLLTALVLAGCGQQPHIPEAISATPLAAATIAIHQTGRAAAVVDQASVRFALDASGSLVVTATVSSNLATAQTIIIRATIYDAANTPIDATGGEVAVPAHATVAIKLNGPGPHGTITAATFEVITAPAPG